ncbi:MAG TPA: GNAT family N-acetyltransferase [Ktedonobacteraceae bacterium]|nr:GNAT family N-acetyltransferase [Ktedonobacteraceae bacterium]
MSKTASSEITIREARLEDSGAIATILHELGWFEHINHESVALTQAQVTDRIKQCHTEKQHTLLVAEHGQRGVVGYVAVHWFVSLLRGNEGYVSELFLHPTETGHGIGGRLLDSVNEYALKRGCTRLMLMNRRIRESYRRGFYTKHGWQESQDGAFFTLTLSRKSEPAQMAG